MTGFIVSYADKLAEKVERLSLSCCQEPELSVTTER